jgi:3-deoxy-D-manno-octulosonic-acid transferase
MQNFAAISRAFVEADAAIQVPDAVALEQAIADLLADPQRREQMGQRAIQVVRENTGALERTIQMIINHLPEEETYVAPVARMD